MTADFVLTYYQPIVRHDTVHRIQNSEGKITNRGEIKGANNGYSLFELLGTNSENKVIVVEYVLIDPDGDEVETYPLLNDALHALNSTSNIAQEHTNDSSLGM